MQRLGGRRELLRDMIEFYLADYPPLLARFETAARAGDLAALGRHAHSLKGLASNFDGCQVMETADAAAQAARKTEGFPSQEFAALSQAADELAQHLRSALATN
jgi:HPt (histidine-containing phosphotransfer) domain-containing protein